MFRIWWTNFGYFSQREFTTLDEARSYGKGQCFDHVIYEGDEIIGSWSVFGGWRNVASW